MFRSSRFLAWPLVLWSAAVAGLPAPDPVRLRQDLYYLASPACAGRGTGEPGQKVAAAFIAKRMKENGLHVLKGRGQLGETDYHFVYDLARSTLDRAATRLTVGSKQLKFGQDFISFLPESREFEAVLVGYGITAPELGWDDYQKIDLNGKWAVLFQGQPNSQTGPFQGQANHPSASPDGKREALRTSGAVGMIVLRTDHPDSDAEYETELAAPRLKLVGTSTLPASSTPRIDLYPSAQEALGLEVEKLKRALEEQGRPALPRSLGTWRMAWKTRDESLQTSNLIGFIPGRDPKLKYEVVVLSAHHDHLGTHDGTTWPGADDNASGTAGILEVGRLLARARPRRSILVLSVSGEENGLFGSTAFLEHPPLNLNRIVADLNLDMIGRGAPGELNVTPAHVEGAVTTLTQDARSLAGRRGIALQDGAEPYWKRSDHYNFALKGIPSLFFFAGMHEDYHEPSDTPDKIDFAKMIRVVGLTRDLVLKVANAPSRPSPIPKQVHRAWAWPSPVAIAH